MQTVLTYRGRAIQHADVAFIRELIASKPEANRRALSIELCRAWDWRQPNGALRDAVCRGLLLALHRGGHVELPAPKTKKSVGAWVKGRPEPVDIDQTPVAGRLRELGPVELCQVRCAGSATFHKHACSAFSHACKPTLSPVRSTGQTAFHPAGQRRGELGDAPRLRPPRSSVRPRRRRRPDDDNGTSGSPDDASVPLGDEPVVQIRALAEARPDADLARREKHPRHVADMLQARNRCALGTKARSDLPERKHIRRINGKPRSLPPAATMGWPRSQGQRSPVPRPW